MSTYWVVSTGCTKESSSKDAVLSDLKNKTTALSELGRAPSKFDVPDGESALKFGSFDDLIRMSDDLAKYDSQVEGIARRLERMYVDVEPSKADNPAGEFKILSPSAGSYGSFDGYLREWRWDEAKYPKTRGLSNNLTFLLSVVNKLDEEARNKSSQYNELKSSQNNMAKKESGSLVARDLTDVLTPEVVKDGDFVTSEHLTTIIVILPQANVKPFLDTYEGYAENVVPGSAQKFTSVKSEDGTEVWRVVMFRGVVEAFMKRSREDRQGTCRQFEYSVQAYEKVKAQREELLKELEKHDKVMKGFCKAAFSDVMSAWVHIKAMRVFVESTLRFGVPANFACFIIQPNGNKQAKMRKALVDVLGKGDAGTMGDTAGDEEDYFPYVSLSITPFTVHN